MLANIELSEEWKLKLTRATDRAGRTSSMNRDRDGRAGGARLDSGRKTRGGNNKLIRLKDDDGCHSCKMLSTLVQPEKMSGEKNSPL